MKIVAITPLTSGKYKDDTTMLCDGLEKYHGCEVIRVTLTPENTIAMISNHTIEDIKSADMVWAPYEPLIEVALYFKTHFGLPVMGHFEMVPITRVHLEEVENHWITSLEPLPPGKYHDFYMAYRHYARKFLECDVRTTTGESSIYKISTLLGAPIASPVYIKPYPLDTEMLEFYKDDTVEKKRQIVSCMRLVDHKRHHHVIKALSLMVNPPKYVIIGEGPQKPYLAKLAKDLSVDVEFKGLVSDEEKMRTIQESLFCVHLWAWLPVGEAAYYKVPSIAYYGLDTYERLNNIPLYTEKDNIAELSSSISELLDHPEKIIAGGEKAHSLLMAQKSFTLPIEVASGILYKYMKSVK